MDAARGVLLHKAKHRLKEFGGKIEITKGWADSFIRRMKQAGYLPESGKTSHWDEKPQSSENIDELHALNAGENTGAHRVVVETPYSNVQPFLPISPNGNVTRDSYGQANIVQYQPGSFLQTTRVHRSIQLQNTALAREKQMCSLLQEAEPGLLLATPADFQVLNTNAPQANTTANPNASQQLTSPLEPSSGLDEQQNHAQAQGTVRFIQSQLASRYNFSHDQLGDGNYLNSTFAQLRPSADQEGGLFTPHSSLEQLSEAAGYVGALLHSGRNEIDALHNQSNDHQNQQQLAPASSSIINLGEQQQQQQQQLNFTDEHRSPPQLWKMHWEICCESRIHWIEESCFTCGPKSLKSRVFAGECWKKKEFAVALCLQRCIWCFLFTSSENSSPFFPFCWCILFRPEAFSPRFGAISKG